MKYFGLGLMVLGPLYGISTYIQPDNGLVPLTMCLLLITPLLIYFTGLTVAMFISKGSV
jgi:hypothetical protein